MREEVRNRQMSPYTGAIAFAGKMVNRGAVF
jgi:hypothetical protein